MLREKVSWVIVLMVFALAGCAAPPGTKLDAHDFNAVRNIKTVSVATFTCSDSLIAQELKNKIVESLLSHYSVIIGDNADLFITGEITLKNNIVSEVKADILKDRDVLSTVSVAQSGSQYSPGIMGKKMGEKILSVLLKE